MDRDVIRSELPTRDFRGPRLNSELSQYRLSATSAFSHSTLIVGSFLLGINPEVTADGVVLTNVADTSHTALLSGEDFTYDAGTETYSGTLNEVSFLTDGVETATLNGLEISGEELTDILDAGTFEELTEAVQLVARTSDEADEVEGTENADVLALGGGNDTANGGDGDDRIVGGSGDDFITGGAGNDDLRGNEGNDTLIGGDGDDRLIGHAGDDSLIGGSGNDVLRGFADNDTLEGGDGDDRLAGHTGEDDISGGAGNDVLRGGNDADGLRGGEGDDRVVGGAGADDLSGGAGADTLRGGLDDDYLDGGQGDDLLIGGAGLDTFFFEVGDGDDRIFAFNVEECEIILDLSALAPEDRLVSLEEQAETGAMLFYGADSIDIIGRGFGELTLDDLLLTIIE
ncbi:MAG: calcium-binding protein [Pseudomonadota bacterium]